MPFNRFRVGLWLRQCVNQSLGCLVDERFEGGCVVHVEWVGKPIDGDIEGDVYRNPSCGTLKKAIQLIAFCFTSFTVGTNIDTAVDQAVSILPTRKRLLSVPRRVDYDHQYFVGGAIDRDPNNIPAWTRRAEVLTNDLAYL